MSATIRPLENLVTLADTDHIGKAATQYHVSQLTLSRQLQRFEEHQQVKIMIGDRTPIGTPNG